jgi:NADH-quinone oxidoreductase subunit D
MTVFLYCFREREDLLRIFEAVSGQRMMTSYFRIGGVALEPPLDLFAIIRKFLKSMPAKIDQYEGLLTGNPIWMGRLQKGVGYLSPETPLRWA